MKCPPDNKCPKNVVPDKEHTCNSVCLVFFFSYIVTYHIKHLAEMCLQVFKQDESSICIKRCCSTYLDSNENQKWLSVKAINKSWKQNDFNSIRDKLPVIHPLVATFASQKRWREMKLLVKRCQNCGNLHLRANKVMSCRASCMQKAWIL